MIFLLLWMPALITVCIFILNIFIPDQIRIASWNIADFHHQTGIEARPDIGTRRYSADFLALERYAKLLDADIVALQEIATREAAERLFPVSEYRVFMSSRYTEDLKQRHGEDIYTAIAIRKKRNITVVQQRDVVGLQIDPAAEELANPESQVKPTRRGTAVELRINNEVLWVMSIHLKSGCNQIRKLHKSRQRSCQALWQQRVPIKRWMEERRNSGHAFVIAGDFNRRFGQLDNRGLLWSYLDDFKPDRLIKFPVTERRACPTRKGKSTEPIDWIVMSNEMGQRVVDSSYQELRWTYEEKKYHRNRLSDHCPISVDVAY